MVDLTPEGDTQIGQLMGEDPSGKEMTLGGLVIRCWLLTGHFMALIFNKSRPFLGMLTRLAD